MSAPARRRPRSWWMVVWSFVFTLACPAYAAYPGVVHRPGEPEVVHVPAEDAEMNQAMAEARRSFATFAERIDALRAAGAYYSVKVPLEVESGVEHIWLDSPSVAGGMVSGPLGNVPLSDRYASGQQVSIAVGSISDWMAVVDGKLFGGYTVLVARARMSAAERAQFDERMEFELPAVATPFE